MAVTRRGRESRAARIADQQRLGKTPRSFAVVQLASRRGDIVYTVWQDLAGALWCDCREFAENAAAAQAARKLDQRSCRHTEIVETARVLAAAWVAEATDETRDRVLRLTPPTGSAPPMRLYVDEGE